MTKDEVKMKPHIRVIQYLYCVRWMCFLPKDKQDKAAIGYTPQHAYSRWKEKNLRCR